MRPNKLTPGHNLKWESSRMMLPEHVEILQQHQKAFQKKEKTEIDEQQAEIFSQRLSKAWQFGYKVRFSLFHSYQDKHVTGRIRKFDPETRQFQLDTDSEWIWLTDVCDIEIV